MSGSRMPAPTDLLIRLRQSGLPPDHIAFKRALSPESVAELLVRGIEAEKFLIGSQGPADAAVELALKTTDYEAWLGKMGALGPRTSY